jgi:hypothetical protein
VLGVPGCRFVHEPIGLEELLDFVQKMFGFVCIWIDVFIEMSTSHGDFIVAQEPLNKNTENKP